MTRIHRLIPAARERNGRHVREARAEERARRDAVSVVLAQPHRRGRTEQGCRWPIGRLILAGKVAVRNRYGEHEIAPSTLERAAERYADLWAEVRWILDSRRPLGTAAVRERRPATPEDRAKIEREWGDAQRALRDCERGDIVTKAMAWGILDASPDLDERTFNPAVLSGCSRGLVALVRHWGME